MTTKVPAYYYILLLLLLQQPGGLTTSLCHWPVHACRLLGSHFDGPCVTQDRCHTTPIGPVRRKRLMPFFWPQLLH
ncbi:hypothetical protein K456DRAFT_53367 [Colletotrichum gloeosporioides 23]|nr:hypothetical protein K456DRAFT_53367 [Colletotrichum gloeosporioides 23]